MDFISVVALTKSTGGRATEDSGDQKGSMPKIAFGTAAGMVHIRVHIEAVEQLIDLVAQGNERTPHLHRGRGGLRAPSRS